MGHGKKTAGTSRRPAGGRSRIENACRIAVAGKCAVRELSRWVVGFGVSETEFRLLWELHLATPAVGARNAAAALIAPPLDQVELAMRLAVSAAQVSGVVERLRIRHLIEHQAHAADRRRQLWLLTPAGRKLVLEVVAAVDALPTAELDGRDAA